jgi:hypothetical protein
MCRYGKDDVNIELKGEKIDILQSHDNAKSTYAYHREKAIPKYGRDTVCVNALLGHEVEEGVY